MIKTFLLEIGCEEIPARMIPPAVDQLREGFRNELQLHHVPPVKVEVFATPRRLAVIIQGLPDRQPDRET
ncbi:MAG: glycine--tRNA ligase subunit beta, partial [Acidobacteriota bacterium]